MNTDTDAQHSIRRYRPVRVLLMRDSTSECRRLANIGTARDGGVWVAPADVSERGWAFGRVERDGPFVVPIDPAQTRERPKVHYHRSGRVYVTRTGTDLPQRGVQLSALGTVERMQIMSIAATRTWQLPPAQVKKGDVLWVVDKWPDAVTVALTVHANPSGRPIRRVNGVLGEPAGLLDGDPDRMVVDLRGHDLPGVLSLVFQSVDWEVDVEPALSVIATSLSGTGLVEPELGLWSANTPRPMAGILRPHELPSLEYFVGEPTVLND